MGNFDSKEEEKFSKSMAEKLKQIHDFRNQFTDEEWKQRNELALKGIDDLEKAIRPFLDKEVYAELPEKDKKFLDGIYEKLIQMIVALQDTQLVLGNSLFVQTVSFMNALKEIADKGDEKAKKDYEELYALYKKALEGNLKDKDAKN